MKRAMKWVRPAAFCLIGLFLFLAAQSVLTTKFTAIKSIRDGAKVLDEDTLDVLFIGSSNMANGVAAMDLYEDAGIVAYNCGTAGQPIIHSYYYLQEILKKQSPKLVVLDVSGVFFDEKLNSHWRYGLDTMHLSPIKVELAKLYAETVDEGSVLSALVPMVAYHSRWSQLSKYDFTFPKTGRSLTAGYYIESGIIPAGMTLEQVDYMAEHLRTRGPGTISYIEDGISGGSEVATEPLTEEVHPRSLEYLLKIKELCEAHGAQFLAVKIPTLRYAIYISNPWTKYKYTLMKDVAEKNDIAFFDLTYDVDVGLDYRTDSIDGGWHLNVRGAEKVTRALRDYLLENYGFTPRSDPQYDEDLPKYEKIKNVALLQSETDFARYLDRLIQNKDKWTTIIVTDDDYQNGMKPEDFAPFEQLGLKLIAGAAYGDAYVALIDRGYVKYEARSDRRIEYRTQTGGVSYELCSSGWYSTPHCHVLINGLTYGMNIRGLNFVVYDNESGTVIDNVCFDTWQESKPYSRNKTAVTQYLQDYLTKLGQGEE